MLLHIIFVKVVIVLNEVHLWEGGLEELVPQHEEVVLEAVVMALEVDIASFVEAHVEFCNALAVHVCLPPAVRTFVSKAFKTSGEL